MNILFANAIDAHLFRGGEKWMLTTAEELSTRGHRVVVSGRPRSRWIEYSRARGLPTRTMPMRGDLDPYGMLRHLGMLSGERFDVVCLGFEKAVRLCGFPARLQNRSAIISRKGLPLMYDRVLYRFAYRHIVDRILTPSHDLKRMLCEHPWIASESVDVVHNGVRVPPRPAEDEILRIRRELGVPEDVRVIVTAGRFSPQKGFSYLLDALPKVLQSFSDVHLVLIGEGELRGDLEHQIERLNIRDRVHLPGYRRDVPRLLGASDLFVLPSLYEGLPNVMLEAMAAGIPVVATSVNGVPEVVEDGVCGRLIPPKSGRHIESALCEFLGSWDRAREIGEAGRRRVESAFTVERMVDGVERVFQNAVLRKRGSARR